MTTPNQRWRILNPDKVRAHWMVQHAIQQGKLTPQPCEQCGQAKAHAHHDDYSQPLSVRWLCAQCHRALHQPTTHPRGQLTARQQRRQTQQLTARSLRAEGVSYRQIAITLGSTPGTVYKWLNDTVYK